MAEEVRHQNVTINNYIKSLNIELVFIYAMCMHRDASSRLNMNVSKILIELLMDEKLMHSNLIVAHTDKLQRVIES